MRTFRVKNFEQFQHYKDRNPPWIKLYNAILDDYEFSRLPDATKFHLIASWLLASRSTNKIPYDAKWVAARINARSPVDLDELTKAGFFIIEQELPNMERDASTMLAKCLPREERETEKRHILAATSEIGNTTREKGNGHDTKRGTRLPAIWNPGEEDRQFAQSLGLNPDTIRDQFRDYWIAKAGQNGVKLDWSATWRNWCRKAAENGAGYTSELSQHRKPQSPAPPLVNRTPPQHG